MRNLVDLFGQKFIVGIYYEPTMENEDKFYYIDLNNVARLVIMMIDGKVMVIHTIIPLTTAYIHKFYKKLFIFLSSQKEYTVLLSVLGNIYSYDIICEELGFELVEDYRYRTVPLKLYNVYKDMYKQSINKYGFYLLAVQESLQDVKFPNGELKSEKEMVQEIKKETKLEPEMVEIVEVIETPKLAPDCKLDIGNKSKVLSEFIEFVSKYRGASNVYEMNGIYTVEMNKINLAFDVENTNIHILNSSSPDNISSVDYMDIFAYLEKFVNANRHIVLDLVRDGKMYNVCKSRSYPRVWNNDSINEKKGINNFGTFHVMKLNKK